VILARGWTRRISGDKALLQWNGKPLVRHALEAYIGLPTEPVIVTKRPQAYAEFGVTIITDRYAEETPISGILTAGDYAADLQAEWVFIAGADTIPTLPHLYRRIWDERHSAPENGAVLLQVAGRIQPFPGLYRTAALTAWRTAYQESRFKLTPTAEGIPARRLAFDSAPYHNVNTTESLPPAWKSA
jgi:molybdopterin-guanine dinucleotide biosynthesis protein A